MSLLRLLLLALAFVTAAPALAQPSGDADWLYRGSDIARDPAWRFGTLPNGLRYAVRRNALPAGQDGTNLQPGDFLVVYRDSPIAGQPRQILGEIGILTTESRTATGKIVAMRRVMQIGDYVERR